MMTSAYLLEEAMSSNNDVNIADWKISRISNDDVSMSTGGSYEQQRWRQHQDTEHSAVAQRREVADEDRTSIMTSAVTSSQSVVSYSRTSRWYLKIAIAKRCRLDKWIRQRFAFALRFSRWFAMIKPAGTSSKRNQQEATVIITS
ncbi:hypothetical protein F511_30100 [Dorcoceras hygrometricum]|uniref:Uncharacterized protein n=1 Tax=Dorcoceras hygrometricum TaxID=472368 RepID=A0A2Z7D092_9LAMI|nr:hypothetical protein F511_30100 [Dorcoceras hygrometricum]